MIGLEAVLIDRAANPAISEHLKRSLENAASNYRLIDNESIVPGNASGYLTTDAEKSMSIYCKVGGSQISGLIKPGEKPSRPGLYLMDVNPGDKSVRALVSKNVSVGIVEMIASGCHMIIFTTGSGSVVGSAISPVIKICSNPQTYERMKGDMDINAGDILHGEITIEKMGNNICDGILAVAAGIPTCSEGMGHQEFMLT
jgi:altronate dehydratase large subunit